MGGSEHDDDGVARTPRGAAWRRQGGHPPCPCCAADNQVCLQGGTMAPPTDTDARPGAQLACLACGAAAAAHLEPRNLRCRLRLLLRSLGGLGPAGGGQRSGVSRSGRNQSRQLSAIHACSHLFRPSSSRKKPTWRSVVCHMTSQPASHAMRGPGGLMGPPAGSARPAHGPPYLPPHSPAATDTSTSSNDRTRHSAAQAWRTRLALPSADM